MDLNISWPHHGYEMARHIMAMESLALLVVGISGTIVTGSSLNLMPIMPVYSTPAQESSGEAVGQTEPTEDEQSY